MAKLEWDKVDGRGYRHGLDRGVLYPQGLPASVWNGLVSVDEAVAREIKSWYQDGVKMYDYALAKPYEGKIKAFTYPSVLDTLLGGQKQNGILVHEQPAGGRFGLSYRTLIGDQVAGPSMAYIIHILYNLTATPEDLTRTTIGGQANPDTLGFSVSGIPIPVAGMRPSCHLSVDSRSVSPARLAQIEEALYGTDAQDAYLPTPAQLIA